MSLRVCICVTLVIVLLGSAFAAQKGPALQKPVGQLTATPLWPVKPQFATAVACTSASVDTIVYYMTNWVTGNELYKAFIDPARQCPNPYPYTVTAVNMPMWFGASVNLVVAVDVEDVRAGSCAAPGVVKSMSHDYTLSVPSAGFFSIWVPLDSPVIVNGPFFAGFFIGNHLDSSKTGVLIDKTPVHCRSYNVWDTTVGWVDLTNMGTGSFPGCLAMEVDGTPGGKPQPAPEVAWLAPLGGTTPLYPSIELWAHDTSGSTAIDYISFEYSSGGTWTEISRDYDGTHALRNGTAYAPPGNGYAVTWDFSNLPAGTYSVRATAVDTAARSSQSVISVVLDPKPPVPAITTPVTGDPFCSPLQVTMQSADQTLKAVQLLRHDADSTYTAGVGMLDQTTVGDANGNPTDGNSAANGEYGDYYSGPVSAALAVKLWADRGYPQLIQSGGSPMTLAQTTEAIAPFLKTRANNGTYDEDMYVGLQQYCDSKGGGFDLDHAHNPDYWKLRTWLEDEQRAVILGVGGTHGLWVTADGFWGWRQADGTYSVKVSNPQTGSTEMYPMRFDSYGSEILMSGWQRVDITISLAPHAWNVSRTLVGADSSGSDGWAISWAPTGLGEDNLYFFRAVGQDSAGSTGASTVLLQYNCAGQYTHGDLNGDGLANVADLALLTNYLAGKGSAPVGDPGRADCNCDGLINIADAVYYMNFLLGKASPPCN